MDGRLSWCDSQKLAIKSVARDGELLIRHVTGRDVPNPFNYAFQLLEPDQLDEDFTAILPNGNFVFMGIEHNRWGRPVAYHILTQHPGRGSGVLPDEAARTRSGVRDHAPVRVRPRQSVSAASPGPIPR